MSKYSDRRVWMDAGSLHPTDKPKHKAHRHMYDLFRERLTRARCDEMFVNCPNWECPRHQPERYTELVAKHRRVVS